MWDPLMPVWLLDSPRLTIRTIQIRGVDLQEIKIIDTRTEDTIETGGGPDSERRTQKESKNRKSKVK
jgi:hypothetical protein